MMIDGFFEYARARYQLMLDKEADFERPWTQDEILQTYRFCNVFREDDRTTKWIRNELTHEAYGSKLLGAMIIARWFNRIETLQKMLPPEETEVWKLINNLLYSWKDTEQWKTKMRERLTNVAPLVTGAYMIKTPAKMNKLEGLLWCLEEILPDAETLQGQMVGENTTLQWATEALTAYPYLGPFMAYEIVTDLSQTILSTAPDIMTWANPGPGCTRGLCRTWGEPLGSLNRHSPHDVDLMQQRMQTLLKHSQRAAYWPKRWPSWDMRTVEHTLCEFDKYERARTGEGRPKQKYKPQ